MSGDTKISNRATRSGIPEERLKLALRHLDEFAEFLFELGHAKDLLAACDTARAEDKFVAIPPDMVATLVDFAALSALMSRGLPGEAPTAQPVPAQMPVPMPVPTPIDPSITPEIMAKVANAPVPAGMTREELAAQVAALEALP